MKKRIKILSLIVVIIIGIISTTIFFNNKDTKKQKSKKERLKELINIDELDKDFIDDYFNDYKEMAARNNQENILIVISENGIKNTYGAVQVVNAPNHQYFLQYETEKDRKEAYKKLKADNYLSVEENTILKELGDSESDEPQSGSTGYMSWGIEAMGLDYAIDETENKDEVVVAIIDGGLDKELFNRYFSSDRIKKVYNVNGSTDVTDVRGHGTHIAGTIAEGTPSNVKIMPIKTSNGNHTLVQVTGALYYAMNNNVDVINISLASPDWNESSLYQSIESAKEKNIIVVAGAGNNNNSKLLYPAGFNNTIGVSNISRNFMKSSGSNFGFNITFAAPGTNIRSIMGENTIISQNNGNNDDNEHEIISGTSMATPHVAAAVAVVKSYNKNLSFEDTVDVLKSTVDDLGDYGWDKYFGYGMINFRNREFCDGANDNCDKYNVFKSDEVDIDEVVKIEFTDTYIPTLNYGNITNLMDADINIYYTENDYVTKKIGELDDVEITNYDAFSYTEQVVSVKYKESTTTLTVDNRNNTTSGFEYQITDNNSIKITGFLYDDNKPIRVYIPSIIDGYDVVSLGDSLFEENDFIKSIILPSSVVEIGNSTFKNSNINNIDIKAESISVLDNAFYGVKDLQAINAKLNYIGEYAFYNCYTLKDISFSNDLRTIGAYAFNNNNNLKDVTLPNGLTYIGEYAFSNTNIDSIVIPATVSEIKEYAFSDCTNLSSLNIENGVKKIGEYAFQKSILTSLNIPASVNSISSTSFIDYQDLKTVTVDVNNNHYRSVNNEIIEIENSKLVFGMTKVQNDKVVAIIPDDIKIIDSYAFANQNLNIIEIPEGVTTVGEYAFYNNPDLEKVYVPKSVTNYATNCVAKAKADKLVYWYHSSLTNLKDYIDRFDIGYRTIDPFDTNVNLSKTNYNAFDTVDTTNLSVVNSYNEKNHGETAYVREETITDNYTIKYNNGETLKAGDTSFIISTTTDTGYKLEKEVPVTVSKLTPEYTVPTNIKANIGDKLSDIELPSGFEWVNDTTLEELGTITYKARYVPEDTNNYETVDDIDISVEVMNTKTVIIPNITTQDKTYDGTNDIANYISVSNLNKSDYELLNAYVSDTNVGTYTTRIKLRLTDNKFTNYSFDNGKQEKEFEVNIRIVPLELTKPTLDNRTYTYNGLEQEVVLNNFDGSKMNITGNKMTNAGVSNVVISLNNNNYTWSDDTTDDITLKFVIDKADINIVDNTIDATYEYDGNLHGINLDITSSPNATIRFMDDNGNYTLVESPEYKDIGTYKVKYKVFIDDNYNEYEYEKNINITNNTIVNNSTDYEGLFDNGEHSINISIEPSNYSIKYSINNTNYDLDELPKFKDVGEYTVNYKITVSGYDDLEGSNKVKIYGIKKIDDSITLKDDVLVVNDNSFNNLSNNITTYSTSTTYSHYNKNNELVTDDNIKTGDIIKININNVNYEYKIAYLGDTSGDGKINYLDYVNVYNHIQKVKNPSSNKKLLTDEYLLAADMSGDNKISYLDYVKIYNKIKELKGGAN